jgi:hypothetical protein
MRKDNNRISFDIYRKPTTTDIIIPRESCHPMEQKLSAIRYIQNRNETYLTDPCCKQKEKHIIDHILRNNNYDSTSINTRKNRSMKNRSRTQKTKWAKFTYTGRETRFITKLFKPFDIGISFTTRSNIGALLRENSDKMDNKCNRSGIY